MSDKRFRDFGSGNAITEPLTFKLYEQEFQCRPALQGKVLLQMAVAGTEDDGAASAKLVETFFAKALLPESLERFNNLLSDSEKIVTVEMLGEIAGWLTEQYSGRPQPGPEQSASGQQIFGLMLTEKH